MIFRAEFNPKATRLATTDDSMNEAILKHNWHYLNQYLAEKGHVSLYFACAVLGLNAPKAFEHIGWGNAEFNQIPMRIIKCPEYGFAIEFAVDSKDTWKEAVLDWSEYLLWLGA